MTKEERIEYCKQRIELAHSTFDAAKLLIENGSHSSESFSNLDNNPLYPIVFNGYF
ncbi:MAG: hypothetical protein GX813_04160 [Erysipelotrichia bacterium]|nr:hypothetical protein [Erysipelotrichia bacterium]